MNLLIDIVHPADVNFYKKALSELKKKNNVTLTVLDRGKLIDIVKKEYPGFEVIPLGKHRKSALGKMVGFFGREFLFISLFMKRKFDKVSSFGFYPAVAAKLFGIKSVLFYDDFEYKFNFNMCKFFGDRLIIPSSIPTEGKKIRKYNGFKELAYLADYTPKKMKGKFVFVRDVAPVSLNYRSMKGKDFSSLFQRLRKEGYEILYYPEDKGNYEEYKEWVTLVKEPIKNIHDLLYNAAAVISSGDTIARESALLGTPTFYTGGRKMSVNKPLIEAELMIEATEIEKIPAKRNKVRKWENPTPIIIEELS